MLGVKVQKVIFKFHTHVRVLLCQDCFRSSVVLGCRTLNGCYSEIVILMSILISDVKVKYKKAFFKLFLKHRNKLFCNNLWKQQIGIALIPMLLNSY